MREQRPLILALILLWAITFAVVAFFLNANETDQVVYSLDDPYIHMAMARNLVEHGVWGVTRYEFSSSSSSPLWVLLLATGYLVIGVRDFLPLLLVLAAASLALIVADRICREQGIGQRQRTVVLLAVLFFTPLVPLVMTGMEHGLQIVVDLAFIHGAVCLLSQDRRAAWPPWRPGRGRRDPVLQLWLCAPLVTAVRYEGAFLIAVVCGLLLLRRQWRPLVALALLGLLPIALYAVIALTQGWPPLPNSILAKAGLPSDGSAAEIFAYLRHGLVVLRFHPDLLVMITAALALFIHRHGRRGAWAAGQLWLLIFAATALLHVQFAQVGADLRYEGYLLALGVVAIGLTAGGPLSRLASGLRAGAERRLTSGALVLLVVCLLAPLLPRATSAVSDTPRAMRNIFQQQYQMGLFLRDYYQGQAVVANDIGAINYLADIRLVDVVGLASEEVLRRRYDGSCDAALIDSLARQQEAVVAVMYADWFVQQYGPLPAHWWPVASWTIPDNIACARAKVDFVGLGAAATDTLRQNLEAFAPRLPAAVNVRLAAQR